MNPESRTGTLLMMSMLVVAVFCTMAGRAIFSPLMPMLQVQMGISLSAAGTLFLLVGLSYGGAMLLSGFLAAWVGHGMTIVIALSAVSAGLLLCAFAADFAALAVGMLLIGSGAGTYPPSGLVMITTSIPESRRNTAFSMHEIGPNLALLVSPLLVIALAPSLGWRGVLILLAGICGLATVAFLRWGVPGSGIGTAPDLRTVGIILRLRTTFLGMVILSAALSGLHGIYAMLPAFLVAQRGLETDYINLLLSASRVAGILLLFRAGAVIRRIGRRRTIAGVLIFSALCTALVGLSRGTLLAIVVVAQPALLTVLFPATLSSMAGIGEARYQNVTYSIIITVGVSIGSGVAPTVLGIFGDLGHGWAGFVLLSIYMLLAVAFLWSTPDFGRDRGRTETPLSAV